MQPGCQNNPDDCDRTNDARDAFGADSDVEKSNFEFLGVGHEVHLQSDEDTTESTVAFNPFIGDTDSVSDNNL